MEHVVVVNHPLVQDKLTRCRQKETEPWKFRELVEEITALMLYEATRDMPLKEIQLETPGRVISGPQPVFIAVLRAGLGMLTGALRMFPNAKAGHIGLYRDHETFEPVEYYCKLPHGVEQGECFLLEPMLATGGSAAHAIVALKKRGVRRIKLLSLIASPEGLHTLRHNHPEVQIFLTAIDEKLNDKAYIVPGLGDAGDRLFGTE
ncbi:MAG TPA: uracil phosphoribosyltransferase [Bacillota bacterium]|nr:uracil phosphoribosyltransferase [Bacillota bacterium]